MGFYRHDQRGVSFLADEVSITVSSTKGVASDSGCMSIEQTKQSRYKCNAMLKHMFMLSLDVNGIDAN